VARVAGRIGFAARRACPRHSRDGGGIEGVKLGYHLPSSMLDNQRIVLSFSRDFSASVEMTTFTSCCLSFPTIGKVARVARRRGLKALSWAIAFRLRCWSRAYRHLRFLPDCREGGSRSETDGVDGVRQGCLTYISERLHGFASE
jgi:hypothetical protein